MSDRNGKNRDYLRTLIIVAFIGALAGVIGDALGIFPYLFPREDRFKSQDSGSHSLTVLSPSRLEKELSDANISLSDTDEMPGRISRMLGTGRSRLRILRCRWDKA